jgi:hypothetical protein
VTPMPSTSARISVAKCACSSQILQTLFYLTTIIDTSRCQSVAYVDDGFTAQVHFEGEDSKFFRHVGNTAYSRITSIRSPSFCTTTFSKSFTNFTALLPQSRDCSCYVRRRILALHTIYIYIVYIYTVYIYIILSRAQALLCKYN